MVVEKRVWLITGTTSYSATKYALEGWSEALAAEVAPFGIAVTLVEPGAFRTGFNGPDALVTSTPMHPYADQMTGLRQMFEDQDGRQPGDPAKAAAAIVSVVGADQPPLHLVLGEDALDGIAAALDQQRAELDQWADLTRSTAVVEDVQR